MLRALLLLGTLLLATGCASATGAVPRPFPIPGDAPPPTASTSAPGRPTTPSTDGYSISSTALSLRGAPYKNGGADPSGFDCSGFVHYVFQQHGMALPRDVRQQFQKGNEIDPASLAPGDLVFFTTIAPGASHVGIAVGGDQFIHAPSTNGVVRVENLSSQYWANRFVGAKRVN